MHGRALSRPGSTARLVKHPHQAEQLANWNDRTFLDKAKLTIQGRITNAAILLVGKDEASSLISPALARIGWFLRNDQNDRLDYAHFGPPFLLNVDRVLAKIRNLTLRELPDGTLFPKEMSQYEPWVLREALHNCIAHQDYLKRGRIVVAEHPDRVLPVNEGRFLPGSVEEVIRTDAPPSLYRNHFLAEAMVNLNMIDTQGGGIKQMFMRQKSRSFPLPDYDLGQGDQMRVSIPGKILDERYFRVLMARTDLDLQAVMLLDKVQKRKPITRDEAKQLKAGGLVEGRFPNLYVAAKIAKATGKAGQHIRERGFDKQYYLNLILKLVEEHGPVARSDVDEALLSKLPDSLSEAQKRAKVKNLLQELRREGKINNDGSRGVPQWVLSN